MVVLADSKREVVRSFGIQKFMTLRKLIGARERPTQHSEWPRDLGSTSETKLRGRKEKTFNRVPITFSIYLFTTERVKRNDKKEGTKKIDETLSKATLSFFFFISQTLFTQSLSRLNE